MNTSSTTQYLWRGLVHPSRTDMVHVVIDSLTAQSVTISSREMHVTFEDGSVAVFDLTAPDASGVAEVCDLSKETYKD